MKKVKKPLICCSGCDNIDDCPGNDCPELIYYKEWQAYHDQEMAKKDAEYKALKDHCGLLKLALDLSNNLNRLLKEDVADLKSEIARLEAQRLTEEEISEVILKQFDKYDYKCPPMDSHEEARLLAQAIIKAQKEKYV